MALQGDLKSFALPDVLRLLAGTGKSGHLEVSGATGSGSVVLRKGLIAEASSSTAPRADDPSDVVYELLRFEDGAFSFEERDVTNKGLQADVDATITQAEALVEEWSEIEAVVPSMEAWLSLAPEVADEVIISVSTWQALAAIGGGGNVHDLAEALRLSDLAASRRVVELVEAQLIHIRATHGYQPAQVELDDFEQFEPGDSELDDPITDFEDLIAEDRPVVMEDREDALLPEPLPGEGVAYEGEAITGIVDGRTFDTLDTLDSFGALDSFGTMDSFGSVDSFGTVDASDPAPEAAPIEDPTDAFEAFESLASFEEAAAMSDRAGEPGTIDGFGGADPFSPADPDGFGSEISADALAEADMGPGLGDDASEVMELATTAPQAEVVVDDERDSLLKFLSSVKP